MVEMTSPDSIAVQVAGGNASVEHSHTNDKGRMTFDYEGGPIQAHRLPDGYRFVGFGRGWFAVKPE